MTGVSSEARRSSPNTYGRSTFHAMERAINFQASSPRSKSATSWRKSQIDLGNGLQIVSAITRDSIERLGLAVGSQVVAVIKTTEVMVATP